LTQVARFVEIEAQADALAHVMAASQSVANLAPPDMKAEGAEVHKHVFAKVCAEMKNLASKL
jgi:hypothetical protein